MGLQRYFVGLDLGKTNDPTALAVLERPHVTERDPVECRRPVFQLRHLHRWPLGTSYPQIVADVVRLLQTPPLPGCCLLADATGVGGPVCDYLIHDALRGRVLCNPWSVTITAGHEVKNGEGWHTLRLPKKVLVSVLLSLLSSHRLWTIPSHPLTPVLLKELQTFSTKITLAGNETFESWRERDHDDLVLALAMAAWGAEVTLPSLQQRPQEQVTGVVADWPAHGGYWRPSQQAVVPRRLTAEQQRSRTHHLLEG
jgi:hypothetical protein